MQRRAFLATGATVALAPFISLGRVRAFAGQRAIEYSTRAVDLVGSSTVVDMLGPFKIGATTWFQKPETFTAADLRRFRDSGINVFHIAQRRGHPRRAGRELPSRDRADLGVRTPWTGAPC